MKLIELIEKLRQLEMEGMDQLEVLRFDNSMQIEIQNVDVEINEDDEPAWIVIE